MTCGADGRRASKSRCETKAPARTSQILPARGWCSSTIACEHAPSAAQAARARKQRRIAAAMFDFVQKHKRVAQIFLAVIGITFATWGIESYTRVRGGSDNAATVNGAAVSKREFDTELRRQQDRQQEQFRR